MCTSSSAAAPACTPPSSRPSGSPGSRRAPCATRPGSRPGSDPPGSRRPTMTAVVPADGCTFLDELAASEPSAATAYELLEAGGLCDGLPVAGVPGPLVASMVDALGRAADDLIASVRPLRGHLTAQRLAVCAALAGCRPEHVRVVAAAAEALEAPESNALGFLSTTSNAALMAVLSGPAAAALGFNGGANCLGPGNRSNAVVGRALSLVTRMVGGAREGHADMATLGQPAKYTFCFAENGAA